MFHWFAARPPSSEQPMGDRPSIPLTGDEREAFERLRREIGPERVSNASLTVPWLVPLRLVPALVLMVAGAAWSLAWLSVNVPLSFLGVLVLAAGLAGTIESQGLRLRPAGSVAPIEASLPQHGGPRHRGQ